jgi:hypothetical protein
MKSVYGRKTTTRRGSPCCGSPCVGALSSPRPQPDWARSSGATARSALPPRAPASSTRRAAPSSISQCRPPRRSADKYAGTSLIAASPSSWAHPERARGRDRRLHAPTRCRASMQTSRARSSRGRARHRAAWSVLWTVMPALSSIVVSLYNLIEKRAGKGWLRMAWRGVGKRWQLGTRG